MKRNLFMGVSIAMMIIAGAALLYLWNYSPLAAVPGLSFPWVVTFAFRVMISAYLLIMFLYGLKSLLFFHLRIHDHIKNGIYRLWSLVFHRSPLSDVAQQPSV
jgi:hypothetical protein